MRNVFLKDKLNVLYNSLKIINILEKLDFETFEKPKKLLKIIGKLLEEHLKLKIYDFDNENGLLIKDNSMILK